MKKYETSISIQIASQCTYYNGSVAQIIARLEVYDIK